MKYFYINNVKLKYSPTNNSIIDYCENLGINIPHFCYHKNLSVSGNCRMCLVELKNSPKPLVSCAMTLANNMEIFTDSPLVKKARENVLEFLLLNHPLDCPVCDQGGECDLQDQSFAFGTDTKRFYNFKRVVANKNLGPIVKTVMTRCIHCTRCVRFADEIAGVSDLGMFGRGLNSEIGMYVTKLFKSELSGNVIDICPVGALTSKPYPFTARSWELKSMKSIDFSDGFGVDIEVYSKNNAIVKILPGYDNFKDLTNWISDKTRFSFNGMFSPERISKAFLLSTSTEIMLLSWKNLFKEIALNLYFQYHLSKHIFKVPSIILIFDEDLSIECLSLILLLNEKYSFLSIKKLDNTSAKSDFEQNYLINPIQTFLDLSKIDFCLLLNINPRYEGYLLNLNLRKRYLKKKLKICNFGSLIDSTYPVKFLGSNQKIFKSIVEGTHPCCQDFKSSSNPTLIIGSEIFKRDDSSNFNSLIRFLIKSASLRTVSRNGLNFLKNSLTNVTYSTFDTISRLSYSNLLESTGLYLINTNYTHPRLTKLIELKLLRYSKSLIDYPYKILIQQNNIFTGDFYDNIRFKFRSSALFNLPNKVFFEDSGTYINVEGLVKKKIKIIPSTLNSKSNWNILRSLSNHLERVSIKNVKNFTDKLSLPLDDRLIFSRYVEFHFLPSLCLKGFSGFTMKVCKTRNYNVCLNYASSKTKLFVSKNRLWLDDFYIGGNDIYSKFSHTMIKCSKNLRQNSSNFNYIF